MIFHYYSAIIFYVAARNRRSESGERSDRNNTIVLHSYIIITSVRPGGGLGGV